MDTPRLRIGFEMMTAALLFAGAICQQAQAAERQIVVAASGGDYTTIHDALAAIESTAANPYVIDVMPGQYYECALPMKSYVHLRGAGRNVTTIRCNAIPARHSIELNNTTNVTISGFRFYGTLSGIHAVSAQSTAVTDNAFEGEGPQRGIWLEQGSPVEIRNNVFRNIYVGVLCINSDAIISNNHFSGNGNGISVSATSGYTSSPIVADNYVDTGSIGIQNYSGTPTIRDNVVTSNSSNGIDLHYTAAAVTVQGNIVTNNGGYGVYMHQSGTPLILRNRITGNGGGVYADIGNATAWPHVSFNVYDTIAGTGGSRGSYNVKSDGVTPAPLN